MKKKESKLDTVDKIGLAMLAPARATRDRIGINEFTLKLCDKLGWEYLPQRVHQVRGWLSTEPRLWQHPRAGVVKAMLEIE